MTEKKTHKQTNTQTHNNNTAHQQRQCGECVECRVARRRQHVERAQRFVKRRGRNRRAQQEAQLARRRLRKYICIYILDTGIFANQNVITCSAAPDHHDTPTSTGVTSTDNDDDDDDDDDDDSTTTTGSSETAPDARAMARASSRPSCTYIGVHQRFDVFQRRALACCVVLTASTTASTTPPAKYSIATPSRITHVDSKLDDDDGDDGDDGDDDDDADEADDVDGRASARLIAASQRSAARLRFACAPSSSGAN